MAFIFGSKNGYTKRGHFVLTLNSVLIVPLRNLFKFILEDGLDGDFEFEEIIVSNYIR